MPKVGGCTPRRIVERIHAFDALVDKRVDEVRSPRLDAVFYGLSSAADHGLLWGAIGALRAAQRGDPAFAGRLAVALTTESLLTNGPIKAMFRRVRPTTELDSGPLPYGMHRPLTSSFPSGHAVTGFTAAMILSKETGAAPLWFGLAGLVASSRVYTRMHHASDVVAGAALGLAFGAVARRFVPTGSMKRRRR